LLKVVMVLGVKVRGVVVVAVVVDLLVTAV
jgi:hypothetical protein